MALPELKLNLWIYGHFNYYYFNYYYLQMQHLLAQLICKTDSGMTRKITTIGKLIPEAKVI